RRGAGGAARRGAFPARRARAHPRAPSRPRAPLPGGSLAGARPPHRGDPLRRAPGGRRSGRPGGSGVGGARRGGRGRRGRRGRGAGRVSEGPGWVLPVDKPEGPTSHDVVARARRALGTRRVGHTGTLDPFASGLLLLCVERATRLAEYLTGLDKRYEATAVLGVSTDTDDREGAVTAETDAWRRLSGADVEEALRALEGEQEQVPPQYSAKK